MTTSMSVVVGKEIVTYEEMSKIDPQPGRPRPIMLIGNLLTNRIFYANSFPLASSSKWTVQVGRSQSKTFIRKSIRV